MLKKELERIETEIRQEKAAALGRSGERLEQILARLTDLRKELLDLSAVAPACPENAKGERFGFLHAQVDKYKRLCEEERKIRHHLVIQREAVGLRRHEDVDRQYPEPSPLTLSMFIPNRDKESS